MSPKIQEASPKQSTAHPRGHSVSDEKSEGDFEET